VITSRDFPGQAAYKTDIDISAPGVHAVRVQLYGKNPLSLAEVQVFGAPDTGSSQECSLVDEHKTATLSCPDGQTIARIDFASYGLPTGSCDSDFAIDPNCHSISTKEKATADCLNKSSCTVTASNGVFGDPCPGKFKRMAILYTCS